MATRTPSQRMPPLFLRRQFPSLFLLVPGVIFCFPRKHLFVLVVAGWIGILCGVALTSMILYLGQGHILQSNAFVCALPQDEDAKSFVLTQVHSLAFSSLVIAPLIQYNRMLYQGVTTSVYQVRIGLPRGF